MTMATAPQAAKGNLPKPQTVPIDTSKPLTPTHALSITHTKHHTILIQELTSHLAELFTATSNLSLEEAQKLIEATPAPPTLFTLKKENLLGTHLTVHDKEGKEVAEWRNPVLNLHAAKITIKFLDGQGEKAVEVIPIVDEKISEVRYPFVPASLVELCSSVPVHFYYYVTTTPSFLFHTDPRTRISQANDPAVLHTKQYNLCVGIRIQAPPI
jgi:hypothetical protein